MLFKQCLAWGFNFAQCQFEILHSTAQCSAVQCSAAQHSTAQHSTAQYSRFHTQLTIETKLHLTATGREDMKHRHYNVLPQIKLLQLLEVTEHSVLLRSAFSLSWPNQIAARQSKQQPGLLVCLWLLKDMITLFGGNSITFYHLII